VQFLEAIRASVAGESNFTQKAARWLAALHAARVEAEPWKHDGAMLDRCSSELGSKIPAERARIGAIAGKAQAGRPSSQGAALAPSHGDFHPMNIFLAPSGRVTVIDWDTFGGRERAADVGYFLSQTAIIGYLQHASFNATESMRRRFLECYEQAARTTLDRKRLGSIMAASFLRSLHYELCILHTGNSEIIEPWLRSAEQGLAGDLELGPRE